MSQIFICNSSIFNFFRSLVIIYKNRLETISVPCIQIMNVLSVRISSGSIITCNEEAYSNYVTILLQFKQSTCTSETGYYILCHVVLLLNYMQ